MGTAALLGTAAENCYDSAPMTGADRKRKSRARPTRDAEPAAANGGPTKAADEEQPKTDGNAPAEPDPGDDPTPGQPAADETPSESEAAAEVAGGPESAPSGEKPASGSIDRKRALVGGLIAVVGAAIPFLIMTADCRFGFSVPVGLFGCIVAAFGILYGLGTFHDPDDPPQPSADTKALGPRSVELLAAVVAFIVALRISVAGILGDTPETSADRPLLPILGAAVLVTATFLWGVVALYRTCHALGVDGGDAPPFWRRYSFWIVVLTTLIYLPLLGSYSLSDPWETHYGEVTREMLARDDWISLWWAQDGFFYSKPVLTFWLEGLCFSLLGVRFAPDQMIASVAEGRFPQPEWAVRLPVFLLTLVSVVVLYKGVARTVSRRAALLGTVVLVSSPYWFFLAHQAMTDMVYVGPLTAAVGLFLLGFSTDPESRVRVFAVPIGSRTLRVSGYHLLFGLIVLSVLPQVLYLVSRHVTLQLAATPHGFRPHLDEFFSGSGMGNCGLPGNAACHNERPAFPSFQPGHGALLWAFAASVLLFTNRRERRVQRLYFIAAWYCVVLSAMGKGAPGLVLGLAIPLVYVGATRRWRDLERLELPAAALLFACVLLPWWAQMYARHGNPFLDRLLFHDMYRRAFVHVHDTNDGVDTSFRYYVWQLGYGLFPWTGLCAAGLAWWRWDRTNGTRQDAAGMLLLWFLLAFCMFAVSLTKFHHYVLPAVPPAAMLTGLLLDDLIASAPWPSPRRLVWMLGGILASCAAGLFGVACLLPGSITGEVAEDGSLAKPWTVVGILALIVGVGGAVASFVLPTRLRRGESGREPNASADCTGESESSRRSEPPTSPSRSPLTGALGVACAVVVALVGRDLVTKGKGDTAGNARLIHLFSYNYGRVWPDSLNYDAALIAFTVVTALLSVLLLIRRWRVKLTLLLCGTAVLWCVWAVNVYLVNTSPHWGQRESIMAYYLDRESSDPLFVSYQMNWKGENFYTGNRTPAWVSSGDKFKEWISKEKGRGVKVMYFGTEPGRVKGLKRELGDFEQFEAITSERLNNKFITARVRF